MVGGPKSLRSTHLYQSSKASWVQSANNKHRLRDALVLTYIGPYAARRDTLYACCRGIAVAWTELVALARLRLQLLGTLRTITSMLSPAAAQHASRSGSAFRC